MTAPAASKTPLPRPFWTLWSAASITNIGDGMLLVAMPLLATRLTRDPLLIALVSFASSIAWVGLALPAGAFADRVDRRWLIVYSNLARLAVVGLLAVFVYVGRISIAGLLVFAVLLGIGEVISDSAQPGLTASLVPQRQVMRAISVITAGVVLANGLAGTALGALLFDRAAWLPFAVDALTFALAAVILASLSGSFRVGPPAAERVEPVGSSLWSEMVEGLQFVRHHPVLRPLAIGLGLVNLGLDVALATIVLFVQDEFGLSDSMYGVLSLIGLSGGLLGSLFAEPLVARIGRARAIAWPLVVLMVSLALIGAAQAWWHVAVLAAIASAAMSFWNIAQATLVQQTAPPELYSRANSAVAWIGYCAVPLGFLLGGVIARTVGLRAPYVIGAVAVAAAAALTFSTVTSRRLAMNGIDADQPAPIGA